MPDFNEPPSINGSTETLPQSDFNAEDPGQNEPSSRRTKGEKPHSTVNGEANQAKQGFLSRLLRPFSRSKQDTSLREVIEEAIENGQPDEEIDAVTANHERVLIGNILSLRDMSAVDVMVPRADVVAIDVDTPQQEFLALLSQKQNSRFPVYRGTLDEVVGTIHMKDILAALAVGKDIVISDYIRGVPIVSPAMPVLDLLVQMRETKKHMVLVVDEFGGIDGLVTIGDIIESIVGEIDDEYDDQKHPQILEHSDGSIIADGRVDIEDFEERFGTLFTDEEREEVDTLGGLVFSIGGRVPARGEVLSHPTGMEFEIVDADPRRINRLKIRNIPQPPAAE